PRERLPVRVGEVLAAHLERAVTGAAVAGSEVLEPMRAIGFCEQALAKRRPGRQRVAVEVEQLVAHAEARLVEIRVLGNDRDAEIGELDAGALQEILAGGVGRERDDARFEDRRVRKAPEYTGHRDRSHVRYGHRLAAVLVQNIL